MVDLIAYPKTGVVVLRPAYACTKSNLKIKRISRNAKLTNISPILFIFYFLFLSSFISKHIQKALFGGYKTCHVFSDNRHVSGNFRVDAEQFHELKVLECNR